MKATLGTSFTIILFLIISSFALAQRRVPTKGYTGWPVYGGGKDSIRYSRLKQITRENVKRLQIAWTYDTGDTFEGSEMQCNPIVVDGVLYAVSPNLRVFALDATTGKEIWSHRPDPAGRRRRRSRGLTHWSDGRQSRIFFADRHRLFALDATNGKPASDFGEEGFVDLRKNLGRLPEALNVSLPTPGIIYKNLLIIGSRVSEGLPSAPGDIRAYDARTGDFRWGFHTIPHPGEPGYKTWPENAWQEIGGANNWSGMSLDEGRGLIYASTGSAAFDFYGGNRHGNNLYANTLLCLEAESGRLKWHFQFVKHDVWDRDAPAPPNLVTVMREGRPVDAVAQVLKSGFVLVFDRVTGKSLFPLQEVQVPQSDIPGERLAATQILPLKPPPFARQRLNEDMLTKRTPEAHKAVLEQFRDLRNGEQFTPPSFEGTIIFPGLDGAGEWGGQAFDPATGLYYVNSNEMAWILRIVENNRVDGPITAERLYLRICASCHGNNLAGSPPEFPSLIDISERRSEKEVSQIIREGRGRMPGYQQMGEAFASAVAGFVIRGEKSAIGLDETALPDTLRYTHDGYNKFLDPDGYPAIAPPWGTLNAIDLDRGKITWSIPFGEFPELVKKGLRNTGSENYGGPVVTAGGILFIGATNHDRKFHAFDKATGELLWETTLPAAGNATPAVYEVQGRQYVVIGSGGGKSGAPSGGTYLAFALPVEE